MLTEQPVRLNQRHAESALSSDGSVGTVCYWHERVLHFSESQRTSRSARVNLFGMSKNFVGVAARLLILVCVCMTSIFSAVDLASQTKFRIPRGCPHGKHKPRGKRTQMRMKSREKGAQPPHAAEVTAAGEFTGDLRDLPRTPPRAKGTAPVREPNTVPKVVPTPHK